MSLIQPKQLANQYYYITGSFTGSFIGDGSGLTNVPGTGGGTAQLTITTTSSFNTSDLIGGISQNGKHVVVNNGSSNITITVDNSVNSFYQMIGTGTITFVAGFGRTLTAPNGAVISTQYGGASLSFNGTENILVLSNAGFFFDQSPELRLGDYRIAETIIAIEQNNFSLDPRTLLSLDSSEMVFGDLNFALNDFTILKRDTSSMVTVHTYVNGEFLNSYWADGIIVATPTGSTGYSLSCGGPIIFPRSGNFVITPVAPHNLNVRPIVLSDDVVISFEIEGRTDNFLCTLDSRYSAIKSTCQLAIRKCTFKANILKPYDRNFLYMIREKLHWGIDSRN
jgi:hypothetical protein